MPERAEPGLGKKMLSGMQAGLRSWPAGGMGMSLGAAAGLAILLLIPAESAVPIQDYVVFHSIAEILAVAVAAMIFGVGWHAARERESAFLVLVSTGFLAVALLDIAHLLSYKGMPDFVSPSGPEKAINFWLAARLSAAVALLGAVLAPRLAEFPRRRHAALAAALAWTCAVYWAVLHRPEWLPATFIPGQGLTPFKIGAEYFIIALLALAALLVLAHGRSARGYVATSLLAALGLMILSEMAFTFYAHVSDWVNMLGHIYKIVAYGFLYHGVFVAAVRQPYRELAQSERNARESEERFRRMFDATPDAVFLVDARRRIALANTRAGTLLGCDCEALAGQRLERFLPDAIRWRGEEAVPLPLGMRSDVQARRMDGARVPVNVVLSPVQLDGERQNIVVARDVSVAREMESLLRRSSQEFSALVDNAQDVIARFDRDMHFLYANPAIQEVLGRNHMECVGRTWEELGLSPDAARAWQDCLREVFEKGEEACIECSIEAPDAGQRYFHVRMTPERDLDEKINSALVIARDISERRRYEEQLRYQATHDALTALPNRTLLLDRLEQAISHARRDRHLLAVAYFDLDHFKSVNDVYGHAAGDELLRQVAVRLRGALRAGDTVGRQGGDEFILLLTDVAYMSDVAVLSKKILTAMNAPFQVCGQEFYASGSLGISMYPLDSEDAGTLLRNADIAMYRAKEAGRGDLRFYVPDMDARMRAQLETERDLRHAIERGELVLHYQPRFNLASGEMVGLEALVRWNHPREGLVGPERFIGVAEGSGLIVPIGEWVLGQACRRARQWQADGLPVLRMAVNLSAAQFRDPGLIGSVERALAESRLDPACLELEITESTVMHDTRSAIETLSRLKQQGVELAVDDFGTGHSSLSYLKLFPIDVLKIDRSFVNDITTDPDDAAIVRAIVTLAHSLELNVVAEGVEKPAQAAFLHQVGCNECQGYYFSRPLPEEEIERLLRDGRKLDVAEYAGTAAGQDLLELPGRSS